MYRRSRRPPREIEFSFDSFLDVVANVVGIILRLILVAWMGARSYKAFVPTTPLPAVPSITEPAALPEPTDDRVPLLASERARIRDELVEAAKLTTTGDTVAVSAKTLQAELAALRSARAEVEGTKITPGSRPVVPESDATLADLKKRAESLAKEAATVKGTPVSRKEFRYRTPVSATVQGEELMFEVRGGRVTLVDTAALIGHIRTELRANGEKLKTQWRVETATPSVGAFRLKYSVERERIEGDVPGAAPNPDGNYRVTVNGWQVEPVRAVRGETQADALKAGSDFRRIADAIDPQQTVVTFWVYPDSFAAYRALRDHLHEKDVVVAGRPLPDGMPIGSSKSGTKSRGQ